MNGGGKSLNWYQLNQKQIERKLHVSTTQGLNKKQVKDRQKQYGLNVVASDKKPSKWFIFLKQFQDFMVFILLGATLIAGLLGEFVDAIAIMIIVFMNACIGFFQESKAEKALDKLQELSAPMASVLREGEWQQIPSQDVVVGDVIQIESGGRVPADMRIVQTNRLEVEESTLTGESYPVAKQVEAISGDGLAEQEQQNMAFMGTLVTRGSGIGVVVQTGMNSAIGKIASLMLTTKKQFTPLERRLTELGKVLIIVVIFLTLFVVGIGIYQGHPAYEMFLTGISLAVAVIPEGLPAIVTVALSLGVQRMIRKKAVVRNLSAVETLGCTTIICSDKTGTITENKMTVTDLFVNGKFVTVTGKSADYVGDFYYKKQKITKDFPHLQTILLYGMLCNHAKLMVKKGKYLVHGDPTDGALLIAARKFGIIHTADESFRIIDEIPFDSDRKRMSVIVEDEHQRRFLIVKGAPETILPRTNFTLEDGKRKKLESKREIENAIDMMTNKALRTIAIGFRPLQKNEDYSMEFLEKDLTFIGLFGMIDPPREGVQQSIEECRQAGIKTIMITGDHAFTAKAIAKQIGLLPEHGKVLEGYELNQLSDSELREVIDDVFVFARLTPAHKLRIVNVLQDLGHVVAMTGDGVNDAPAIKASNIGISMGRSGTDVTREASSLILLDDNFRTIKEAIKEGRNIYANILKFIRYILASNVGEITVMLLAMLAGMPLPLVPVQILWVNLVTDGLPAMALGLDKPQADHMKQPPRNPKEGIFANGLAFKIISRGILIGVVSLIAFLLTYHNDPENLVAARTVAFTTLVLAQLVHVYDCRNDRQLFSIKILDNLFLLFAVISSFFLLLVVIYWVPLQPIFHTTPLYIHDWLLVISLSVLPTLLFYFPKKKN